MPVKVQINGQKQAIKGLSRIKVTLVKNTTIEGLISTSPVTMIRCTQFAIQIIEGQIIHLHVLIWTEGIMMSLDKLKKR